MSVGHVSTVANTTTGLRSLGKTGTPSDTLVIAEGYHSQGDGGGGQFYWDGSSSATDNGGTVILPDTRTGNGRWIRISSEGPSLYNVRAFGAKGDSTTDDATAVQAAVDAAEAADSYAGAIVFFPPGRFSVESAITYSAGVYFMGASSYSARVINNTSSSATFTTSNSSSSQNSARFQCLFIELTATGQIGIDLTSFSNSVVDQCRIMGDLTPASSTKRGIGILGDADSASGYNNLIIGCHLENLVRGMKLQNDANAFRVFGGQFVNNTWGIEVADDSASGDLIDELTLVGVRLEGNLDHGVRGFMRKMRAMGCRFEGTDSASPGGAVYFDNGTVASSGNLLIGGLFASNTSEVNGDALGTADTVLRLGENANDYTDLTGSGTRVMPYHTYRIGNPGATGRVDVQVVGSDTDEDLELTPKGVGSVVSVGPVAVQSSNARVYSGTGDPDGGVTAVVGSLYLRTDGGTDSTLYVKESGTGSSGWAPVNTL